MLDDCWPRRSSAGHVLRSREHSGATAPDIRYPLRLALHVSFLLALALVSWSFLLAPPATIRIPGEIAPERGIAIKAPIAGEIVHLAIENGKPVEKGQVLLSLEDPAARIQIQALKARATDLREEEASIVSILNTISRSNSDVVHKSRGDRSEAGQSVSMSVTVDPPSTSASYWRHEFDLAKLQVRQGQEAVHALKVQADMADAKITALEEEKETLANEMRRWQALERAGAAQRSHVDALKRALAKAQAQIANARLERLKIVAAMDEAKMRQAMSRERLIGRLLERRWQISQALREADERVKQLSVLKMQQPLRAPQGGHVLSLGGLAEGQLVERGDVLLKIIPKTPPQELPVWVSGPSAAGLRAGDLVTLELPTGKDREGERKVTATVIRLLPAQLLAGKTLFEVRLKLQENAPRPLPPGVQVVMVRKMPSSDGGSLLASPLRSLSQLRGGAP